MGLLGGAGSAHGEIKPDQTVWFQPLQYVAPGSNLIRLALFGRTKAQTSISIDPSLIVTANPEFDANAMAQGSGAALSTVSDDSGHFQLNFEVPAGLVQVPVALTPDQGERSTILLTLQISSSKIKMNLPVQKDDGKIGSWRQQLKDFIDLKFGLGKSMAAKLRGVWIHLGLGINYQTHSQSLDSGTSLKFQSLKLPSLGLLASYARNENWLFNFGYRYTPGKAGGVSPPYTLQSSDFVWSSYLMEMGAISRQKSWREKARLVYLFGFQQHYIPHFTPTFGYNVLLRTVQITSASVGPEVTAELTKNVIGNAFLKYQIPLSSNSLWDGGSFKVNTDFAFDGSIGLAYALSRRSLVGLYWFGQWYKYRFSSVEGAGQTSRQGDQVRFYSNLDVRYVLHFE